MIKINQRTYLFYKYLAQRDNTEATNENTKLSVFHTCCNCRSKINLLKINNINLELNKNKPFDLKEMNII